MGPIVVATVVTESLRETCIFDASLFFHGVTISSYFTCKYKCLGHVVCMKEMRNVYSNFVRKYEGKKPPGNLGMDGRIILQCIKQGKRAWTGFIWLRIRSSGRLS